MLSSRATAVASGPGPLVRISARTGLLLCCVGLVPVDLPVCGACCDRDCLAVDVEPETVVACGDGDDLVSVDHAGVDALGGDHDGAALRHAPLDDDRPGAGWWRAGCAAGSSQPVPVGGLDGAGQGAQQTLLGVALIGGGVAFIEPSAVASAVRQLVDSATKVPETNDDQESS